MGNGWYNKYATFNNTDEVGKESFFDMLTASRESDLEMYPMMGVGDTTKQQRLSID